MSFAANFTKTLRDNHTCYITKPDVSINVMHAGQYHRVIAVLLGEHKMVKLKPSNAGASFWLDLGELPTPVAPIAPASS